MAIIQLSTIVNYFSSLPLISNWVNGTDTTSSPKVNATIVGSLPNQTLVEQKTQVDAVAGVLTFSANVGAIEIYNTDATNAGTFIVNGVTLNVPATKSFMSVIGGTPSPTVTIAGPTTYIVSRYI